MCEPLDAIVLLLLDMEFCQKTARVMDELLDLGRMFDNLVSGFFLHHENRCADSDKIIGRKFANLLYTDIEGLKLPCERKYQDNSCDKPKFGYILDIPDTL